MSWQHLNQPYISGWIGVVLLAIRNAMLLGRLQSLSVALFYTMTDTLFWDLPGDALAAPASALCGW